jgi:hypothetical protein
VERHEQRRVECAGECHAGRAAGAEVRARCVGRTGVST